MRPEVKKKGSGGANKLASLMGRKSNASETIEEVKKSPEELQSEILKLKSQLSAGSGAAVSEDMSTKPILGYWNIRGLGA